MTSISGRQSISPASYVTASGSVYTFTLCECSCEGGENLQVLQPVWSHELLNEAPFEQPTEKCIQPRASYLQNRIHLLKPNQVPSEQIVYISASLQSYKLPIQKFREIIFEN